ncbi:CHAD domain-containing protein [Larkinella insperata]|uniref:CHAD domain-containing protein n=1 Tax=Larkinella insperata TaxID=332158 RepID=A0ABW3QC81_9BACT
MSYVFKSERTIALNIHRILAEQIQVVRETLENSGQAREEAIHGVRKRIKKIRALFRLVEQDMHPGIFKQTNRFYRTIGQRLSPLRDATVMINTLDKLRQTPSPKIAPPVLAALRRTLIQKKNLAARAFFEDSTQLEALSQVFSQAPVKISGLKKHTQSFSVFEPNLKKIYRRGRKALQIARKKPGIDHLYELRKQVKNLWYHTRLLKPTWPGLLGAYARELDQLGELLGDDHDLGVLSQEIESERLLMRNKHSKAVVLQALGQQRAALQEQLFPLANRLFAEKAGEFVGRYRLYWKLWRKESRKPEMEVSE